MDQGQLDQLREMAIRQYHRKLANQQEEEEAKLRVRMREVKKAFADVLLTQAEYLPDPRRSQAVEGYYELELPGIGTLVSHFDGHYWPVQLKRGQSLSEPIANVEALGRELLEFERGPGDDQPYELSAHMLPYLTRPFSVVTIAQLNEVTKRGYKYKFIGDPVVGKDGEVRVVIGITEEPADMRDKVKSGE
jgi:hypothetical protein